ncbi:MAG: urease accessory protein UreD [Rhodobacteraceae bacterium]|nr:urease accessory protein UreD [Paracoccaceae bacterium]
MRIATKRCAGRSALDRLQMSGALRALFPRAPAPQAILVNTAGGLTGGDRIAIAASAGAGSRLVLTTQSAERIYRAAHGCARVRTQLRVAAGASLDWLPQETILFDGSALDRALRVDLAPDARFLMVEPVVFGRAAMGERVLRADVRDRIEVRRGGRPLWLDAIRLEGAVAARLDRPALAQGGAAMAALLYVAPDAAARLGPVRALLPATGGASLLAPDVLALRLVAADGFGLRAHLVPVLEGLCRDGLPRSWRL